MRAFDWFGESIPYIQQELRCPEDHIGERTIEVPIARRWLDTCIDLPACIEVGAVMPYWARCERRDAHTPLPAIAAPWHVIDYGDPYSRALHVDAVATDYTGREVLSISTLEHFGIQDQFQRPAGQDDPLAGVTAFERICQQASRFLLCWAVGYHPLLDQAARAALEQGRAQGILYQQILVPEIRNVWEPIPYPTEADWHVPYTNGPPYGRGEVFVYSDEFWRRETRRDIRCLTDS